MVLKLSVISGCNKRDVIYMYQIPQQFESSQRFLEIDKSRISSLESVGCNARSIKIDRRSTDHRVSGDRDL